MTKIIRKTTTKISDILQNQSVKEVYIIQDEYAVGENISVNNDKELNVDSHQGTIVIEFTNGLKLYCWNSEWGGITTKESDIFDET